MCAPSSSLSSDTLSNWTLVELPLVEEEDGGDSSEIISFTSSSAPSRPASGAIEARRAEDRIRMQAVIDAELKAAERLRVAQRAVLALRHEDGSSEGITRDAMLDAVRNTLPEGRNRFELDFLVPLGTEPSEILRILERVHW